MSNYDFTAALSPIDFELFSKDILEAELGLRFENFRQGPDKGIDLRYAPALPSSSTRAASILRRRDRPAIVVQCKRYSHYSDLKSALAREELPKIVKLNPHRYVLTTSASLSPSQADELMAVLAPFIRTTDDIYGRERLNALLTKHQDIERRHVKLWLGSAGVLDTLLHGSTYAVSQEEVERTVATARVYVKNPSFDEALAVLKAHRVCIISGIPGIGKTTLARMLLLYFYRLDYEVLKIESDISEARQVLYHGKPRFYYYDDFLGQTAQADKLNKNEDQKLIDFMSSVRDSKHSVFVLTTREYILNQAQLHYEKLAREKLDYRTCIIDLSKYSRRIRAEILYNHLHFSDLPRRHVQALVGKRGYLQIVDHRNYNPRLIESLTSISWIGDVSAPDYFPTFMRNLDNPVLIWEHAFDFQISDGARDLLTVLATMPIECRLEDLISAFDIFHAHHRTGQHLTIKREDFSRAVKEVDGTFVANRRVGGGLLVQFQNPSIRDFVRGRILCPPLLGSALEHCVFFEQAMWFSKILLDERRYVPLHIATEYFPRIVGSLQRLTGSPSCSVSVRRYVDREQIIVEPANMAARVTAIASFLTSTGDLRSDDFLEARLVELTNNIQLGKISTKACLPAIAPLQQLGLLTHEVGIGFISALKENSNQPSDLDGFKTLAELTELVPEAFDYDEQLEIRERFRVFAETFVSEYEDEEFGVDDPDVVREDATALESLGLSFAVDTSAHQTRLEQHADKKEKEQRESNDRRWDDNEYGGDSVEPECTDSELDSIFGTLTP